MYDVTDINCFEVSISLGRSEGNFSNGFQWERVPYLGQYIRARAVVNPPDKEKLITPDY
jgi:hypothetical protein